MIHIVIRWKEVGSKCYEEPFSTGTRCFRQNSEMGKLIHLYRTYYLYLSQSLLAHAEMKDHILEQLKILILSLVTGSVQTYGCTLWGFE